MVTQSPPIRFTRPSVMRRSTRLAARAFTLIEILVVLAIAAMIMGLGLTYLPKVLGGSNETVAKLYVSSQMELPLFQYRTDLGDYPSTADGLRALIAAPSDKAARWSGPYIKNGQKSLIDPWSEPYQYRYPGVRNKQGFDLWSKGPDKADGTPDDIGNWTDDGASVGGM